jgi:archaellum component FlaC
MTVRIGKVELIGVQDIYTEETSNLVEQRVPDQKGSIFQDLGRDPVTVVIVGLLFGTEVLSNLEQLRQAQEKADPLPFAADIAIGTELTEVIIEDLKMRQLAGYVDRYRFAIRVREHVEPPESPDKALAAVNEGIAADADAFAADSIAAAGALQDPSKLSNVLADNPGALAQMSADDLAGALADKADSLSAEDMGGVLKSVGALDPDKMGGMLDSMKNAGALGGFMEKFADAGKSLKKMLEGIDLAEAVQGIVALFTAGVELIRLLKEIGKAIQDVLSEFKGHSIFAGLEGFLKTSIEKLKELIKVVAELVVAVSKVVKALKPKQDGEESASNIAEKLNCSKIIGSIVKLTVETLRKVETALAWLGDQLVDLGGVSGLLGTAVPLLAGGPQFVDTIGRHLEPIGISGSKNALGKKLQDVTDDFGKVLDEGKVGLEKIWEISEAIADLDAPIFALNDKISELRQDIETFQPHNKQAPLIENSKQPEVQHAK